jgi:hypothetical protein
MGRLWTAIKNIQGAEIIGFFAFISLAVISLMSINFYMALFFFVIGVGFVIISAYNSYRQRSTELVDKYEERFFIRMKTERKFAAKYLLGEHPDSYDLEFILDFFEAPIADKMLSKIIMEEQVYEYFRHWIILYYLKSKQYIKEYREKHDVGSWTHLKPLYDRIIELKKQQYEIELGKKCTEEDVIPDEKNLIEYLKQEAGLKTN